MESSWIQGLGTQEGLVGFLLLNKKYLSILLSIHFGN